MVGKPLVSFARTLNAFQFLGTAVACATLVLVVFVSSAPAQIAGRNVNMVSGTTWPEGDPYLQRQNEPSVAASTRNPLHLLAGANDYRTVDIPFVTGGDVTGDAWLGVFKSFDGGQRWTSTLVPGYPQDMSANGIASPLKGYAAAADPVVRPGTSGLLYYSGMVFDRTANGRSAIFVARFIDNNNQENGDTIAYNGASIVAKSTGAGGEFFDKPWLAVDIPRGNAPTCRIVTPGGTGSITQTIPAGYAYVAYTRVWYDARGLMYSEIRFTASTDCGRTWSPSVVLSRAVDRLNQGASIAIDPNSGRVFVTWRRISAAVTDAGNAMMAAQAPSVGGKAGAAREVRRLPRHDKDLPDPEKYFEHRRGQGTPKKPVVAGGMVGEFDQATEGVDGSLSFRTNAYPSIAIDGSSRIYMAWTERGLATGAANAGVDGDARIVVSTSSDGIAWSNPRPVANEGNPGHQLMPTLTFGGGKLVLVYYDLREDVSDTFAPFVDDKTPIDLGRGRHTLDMRASFGTPGAPPVFQPSIRVSDYLVGYQEGVLGQLQFNAPNLPMFRLGTAPFMGDYVDVALAPAFVPAANGGWAYNTNGALPVFHAVWTDNRDVRAPRTDTNGDGNPWNDYTAPTQRLAGTASVFDPVSGVLPTCSPENTGARNQNIYTARLTTGLLVGSPGNTKPLSRNLQRAFVVFAQNTSSVTKAFRLTIVNQPAGGRASFRQFDGGAAPQTTIDVTTPARSTSSRSVYATSSDPAAQIKVTVAEIAVAGGATVPGGLKDVILLNPDSANPAITNPAITNPAITNPAITNEEVYNPAITNPAITNPAITNPAITNPAITNPAITNPAITNPAITNPAITNPDMTNPAITNVTVVNPAITNPAITNPAITNPAITNPAITNGSLTDVTWTMTNTGNTTAAFNVNLFLANSISKLCSTPQTDSCIATQLIIQKTYTTPTATACTLEVETHDILVANILNPRFVTPASPSPGQNDPAATNATIWLAPGETAVITLRIIDPTKSDNVTIDGASIDPVFLPPSQGGSGLPMPAIAPQGVPSDAPAGVTTPPVVYPTGSTMAFTGQPSLALVGAPISPMVSVRILNAARVGVAGVQVTLTLFGTSGAAVLSGNQVITDSGGTAAFPLLRVNTPGIGYQLQATASLPPPAAAIPPAFSLPFTVRYPLVAVPLARATNEDAPLTIGDALAVQPNPNGGVLSIAGVGAASHGTTTFTAATIRYTPALHYSGPDSFSFTVTDGMVTSAPATVTITVNPTGPLTITTTSLPDVVLMEASALGGLVATGGSGQRSWSVGPDTLPPGVTLDGVTGGFTGMPARPGEFSFTVSVTDCANSSCPSGTSPQTATMPLTMTVYAPDQVGGQDSNQSAINFGGANGYTLAQVFTVGVSGTLAAVKLPTVSCPAGAALTIAVTAVGGLAGRPLESSPMTSWTTGSPGAGPIRLPSPVLAAAGTPLALVLSADQECQVQQAPISSVGYRFGQALARNSTIDWQPLQNSPFGRNNIPFETLVFPVDGLIYADPNRPPFGETATAFYLSWGWGGMWEVLLPTLGGPAELFQPYGSPTMTTVGSMVVPRVNYTATLLYDGTVLIVGGQDPNDPHVTLNSIELFTPATGEFQQVATLAHARASHTATMIPTEGDGLLILGGEAWDSAAGRFVKIAEAEIFTPYWNTISSAGNLLAARSHHTAAAIQDRGILITGGYADGPGSPAAEYYDPSAAVGNEFSLTAGPMAVSRVEHTATVIRDGAGYWKVLLAGGTDSAGRLLAEAELFDPDTGTFSPAGTLLTPRRNHTATVLDDGSVLLAGGTSTPNTEPDRHLASLERYVLGALPAFSNAGSLIVSRTQHAANNDTGALFVVGGRASAKLGGRTIETYSTIYYGSPPFAITTVPLPNGIVGQVYTATLGADGGWGGPYTFGVSAGSLPTGLALSFDAPTGTTTISGIPAVGTEGPWTFTLEVTDASSGEFALQTVTIRVNALEIQTTSPDLPNGVQGAAYSYQLALRPDAPGMGTVTWSAPGSLPSWLTLSSGGFLSGSIPDTVVGSFSFEVQVQDSAGQVAYKTLTVVVTTTIPDDIVTASYGGADLAGPT